jgi:hypothetical protein
MKNPFIMIKLTGSQLSISRFVNASSQEAWDLLTDTRKWHQWGPTVIAADCADRYIRKGALGRVQILSGQWLQFVITEYEHHHFSLENDIANRFYPKFYSPNAISSSDIVTANQNRDFRN